MESRDNTLKVGLVVVAAIVLAVMGYIVLQDVFILHNSEIFWARFDTARGLQEGTVVELYGQPIGKTIDLELGAEGKGSRVKFRIDKNYKKEPVVLYPEYQFIIAQDDFFGEKYVNVVDPILDVSDTANQIVDALDSAQRLVMSVSEPSEWSPAAAVPESIQELSRNLSAQGRALSSSTSELNRLMQLAGQQTRWQPVIDRLREASASLGNLAKSLYNPEADPEAKSDVSQAKRLAEKSLTEVRTKVVQADKAMQADRTPVGPGFEFVGRNRSGISNMLAGAISETLTQAGDMMGTEEIRANIDDIASGMITTLGNVNQLVISINNIVGGSEGYVAGSFQNLYAMSDNFRIMSEELRDATSEIAGVARDPAQRERWEKLLANAEETSANLANLSASLNNLAGDEQLQQDIKDSVRLTKETLEETKNTVVKFQDTLDRTDELMDSADSLMGDAGEAIGEARQKMDQLDRVGDAVEIKMGLNVRAVDKNDDQQLNNEDIYVGDLNAAVGFEDTYVYVGADNIGEDNNFNLMMGYGSLAGLSFRGGVYRGELGLGAAYYDDFGAEVTMYDTEDPKFNAYGYIPIADQLNLVVGGEDLGNDPVASVGIGVDLE
jgi:ABC-type transporter Mla subunit MlaD